MKIWITTDTHFGHKAMLSYCNRSEGFEKKILKNLKQVLKSEDILIHLGDICIGDDLYWNAKLKENTNCRQWLIQGNHDGKSSSWYLAHGWDFVGYSITMNYGGKKILFSHAPQYYLVAENGESSYDLNIHGHFHNNPHRSEEKEMKVRKNFRQRLVAIENTHYQPISLESLLK